jgi:hypothetical protein
MTVIVSPDLSLSSPVLLIVPVGHIRGSRHSLTNDFVEAVSDLPSSGLYDVRSMVDIGYGTLGAGGNGSRRDLTETEKDLATGGFEMVFHGGNSSRSEWYFPLGGQFLSSRY